MVDFSIIIPHRGTPMGLWMTIQSCELDFEGTDLTREYIVIGNGEAEHADTHNTIKKLEATNLLRYYSNVEEPMAPPIARQIGTQYATGKYLAFFDNHCLVVKGYFQRAKADFEAYNMDMLHSSVRYDFQDTRYHYQMTLKGNFWGKEAAFPEHEFKPYRIAMAGHGGFMVRKDVFEEVGGYWSGFVGYAGEEPYFDLKMALLGKTNWVDPKIVHVHYAGKRGYERHYSDDFFRNMLAVAHIIGGEKWMYKAFQGLSKSTRSGLSTVSLYTLMEQAYYRSKRHADWLAERRIKTLDEALQDFVKDEIAH